MNPQSRFNERAHEWRVTVERTLDTDTSLIAFGQRDGAAVVLKIVKRTGDEWTAGKVARAFDGHGVVPVHEEVGGPVLLERLLPGHSLVEMSLSGADDAAMDIAADVMRQMVATGPTPDCPTVYDWAGGFTRYLTGRDRRIPLALVDEGHRWFSALATSQQHVRLLHGDLHHYNILFDATRAWLAIDPKGVVGELEYEIGAILRNPIERPDAFLSTSIVERRVSRFATRLSVDVERTIGWAFAQAVLSALWSLEDSFPLADCDSALRLASAIRPMLPSCP